jgi:uncharacterized repeat protein (TIGR03803 family)
MSKIGQGCGMLALACVLGATGIAVAQTATEIVLHNFEANLAHGANPYAGVIRDSAGNLYGTTYSGGAANAGVVYQVDTAGHQTVLYSFTGGADGANPYGGVIGDSAGNLYGTTLWGGTGGVGVVYKVGATGETVLHSFTWDADGFLPQAGVIRDPAGNLYGTTSNDGGGGVVYKLDPAGQYTVLCSGYAGRSGVIRDPAGNLYWTGPADQGAVYKLDTAGNVTVLYSFTGRADGGNPQAGVTRDSAGNLYGTTANGGSAGGGVAYKLDTAGNETVLYSFPAGFYGAYPSGVIRDSAGNLYGTIPAGLGQCVGSSLACGYVYKLDTAGNYTVLYTFTGGADGGSPDAGVIRDSAGNLYGTTHLGGAAGAGAVYKLDATGQETVVYGFPGAADGSEPWAGVIRDSAGNLYGTTRSGGTANAGVVYKLDTAGRETVLHTFTGGGDGGDPWAGVIRGSAGNLYGTTSGGGTPGCYEGCGVVYKLDATGQETVLYTFTGGADGGAPYAGVIRDSAGNFYGTTSAANLRGEGGAVFKLDAAGQETVLYSFPPSCAPRATDGVIRDPAGNLYGTNSCGGATYQGVVYKLDTAGNYTALYTFTGGADGGSPNAGVIRDSEGNLYGTTALGGVASCFQGGWCGVVFKLDTTGHETVLYNFTGGADGSQPNSVIRDSAGNLYGTTSGGGVASLYCPYGCGVVYKLDTAGHETVLYSFTGGTDGGAPDSGVIGDSAGNLYGTTSIGGKYGGGVVFKLKPQ